MKLFDDPAPARDELFMIPAQTVTEAQPLLPFLFAGWPEVKRTKVKQWLKFGAVHVNEKVVTRHDHELQAGDKVSISPTKAPPPAAEDLPEGLKILFEDEDILVIHKPEGLLTMATEKEKVRTAYSFLTTYRRDSNYSGAARVWIVHRLDRETSGVLLFAKTEEVKETLQSEWQSYEKRYLALVEGAPPASSGTLRDYIDESQPHRVFVRHGGGEDSRLAVTHYRVLRHGMGRTLVELTLETGRRHQIRVQLSEAGCPVVGDPKYGAKSNPAKRLALHSTSLKIQHPVTGDEMTFESPLPPELVKLLPSEV
ncbi:pseudouridine synthase [Brevifollis gellanilyticus]|uniref:Pseudouridine synthase n=2 Tax=Brevifollis gellanilyticus TaxID=748831 RepID=A0A512MI93_9BACT|nr:pseudouridine synthase [Brevifollis gellanilyticus]